MAKKAKKSAILNGKPKRSSDSNVLAHQLIRETTEKLEGSRVTDDEVSRVMASLGRKGGKVGGKARAASLTPERRRAIALKAARSRWDSQG
jgi:hypothetical protein